MTMDNYHPIQQRTFFSNNLGLSKYESESIHFFWIRFFRKPAPNFSELHVGYPYQWIQQLCKCQIVPLQRQELVVGC